jgi:phosphohistidine phosphatase SixA
MKCYPSSMSALSMLALLAGALSVAGTAHAQTLTGDALVNALRHGGYVIVWRHTSSPREAPDKQTANADNVNQERQLDQTGRTTAIAMGKALRELKIPVGEVLTSPTYRAMETIRLSQLANARPQVDLGDGGQSMQGVAQSQAAWLRTKVTQLPSGTNTILVTHLPNMAGAFPQSTAGLADGESLVFGPDGKGGSALVARVKIEDWPTLQH